MAVIHVNKESQQNKMNFVAKVVSISVFTEIHGLFIKLQYSNLIQVTIAKMSHLSC